MYYFVLGFSKTKTFPCKPPIIFYFFLFPLRISSEVLMGLASAVLLKAGEVIDQGGISSEANSLSEKYNALDMGNESD